jgi:hypothetical protein
MSIREDEYVDGSRAQPCRPWPSANFDRLGNESSVDVRANMFSGGLSSSGNDVTEANSGPSEWTQIGSSENRTPQSSLRGRFGWRIDQASLAAMADLGMSEAQIARYRRLWWRDRPSAIVRADAQKTI